jgi:RimJ/RimL family protein N-acetyltransferase
MYRADPMTDQPTFETRQLRLRPFVLPDAPDVQRLAGHREVARFTLTVPHPYPDGAAEQWIASHPAAWAEGRAITCAIERRGDGRLVGAIGLTIDRENENGEIGYWVGPEYHGNGYATESAAELVRFAFDTLHLQRVTARHFGSNPASGRVLQKIGMMNEGTQRRHFRKWGEFEDIVLYGILATDRVR